MHIITLFGVALVFSSASPAVSAQTCGFAISIACENGGTCTGGECVCDQGFTGSLCEFAISLSLTDSTSYQESAGGVTITVNRTQTGFPLNVSLATSGTATFGNDFLTSDSTLSFENNEDSVDMTLTIIDDDVAELDETVTITVTAVDDGTSAQATYTILQSDPVTLSVESATTFAESAGQASITVKCIPPSDTPSASFDITSADGTATAGLDYTFTPASPYSCTVSQTFTVDINILTDNTPETDEDFTLSLTSTLPFTGLTASGIALKITDDDPISITTGFQTEVTEGSADINLSGTTFTFVNNVAVPVSLTVTVGAGTAVLNSDYTLNPATPSFTFTYDAADPTSRDDLDNFRISFPDDSTVEPEKTLDVTFTSNFNLTGPGVETTIKIKDDDPDTLTLTGPSTAVEGDGATTFTLSRNFPPRSMDVDFSFKDADDNELSTGTVSFAVGQSSATFDVNVTDSDNVITPPRSFFINVSSSLAQAVPRFELNVTDDDAFGLTITPDTVVEGDSITLSLTRDSTVGILAVDLTTADGTAVEGSDYRALTTSVTFQEGTPTMSVTIATIEDSIHEAEETFSVGIASTSPLKSTSPHAINITDDDAETLTLTGPGSVNESAGFVTLTVGRSTNFTELKVFASTLIPSAAYPIESEDIVTFDDMELDFAIGEDSLSFNVTINDDEVAENDEVFGVNVTAPSIDGLETMVTIVNDDAVEVTMTSFLAAYENAGSKEITLTRAVFDKEATVQINTDDVTAKAGTHYTPLTNHEVTFAAGSATAQFSVQLQDNSDDEEDKIFSLSVKNTTLIISPGGYSFRIIDNDGSQAADCRRENQDCKNETDICFVDIPICQCVGFPPREGDMCDIITEQKNGPACAGVDCGKHGVCLDDAGSTSCGCTPGYYGDKCQYYFLIAICSRESMIFIANPYGNFGGIIYVKGKFGVNGCNATAVNDPPNPDDDIDDNLEGYYVEVPHNSTECGDISPQEEASEISLTRQFLIQYSITVTTGTDQCVTVICKFNKDSIIASPGVVTVDPTGPYTPETTSNTFSPLSLAVYDGSDIVTETKLVPLARTLCVIIRIPQEFGAMEILDIEFNNTKPDQPLSWRVFTSGCIEAGSARFVLTTTPEYLVSANKLGMKFCFKTIKFANSDKLTVQIKVRICLDPTNCNVRSCPIRRKRQTETSREEIVKATFNIEIPSTQAAGIQRDPTATNATVVITEAVCQLPMEFVPTVIGLGFVILILVLVCLYLTYRLTRRAPKELDKPPVDYPR